MTIIENGALARTIRETADLYHIDLSYTPGEVFVVQDYVSAEDAEDGEAFYYGDINGGMSNICVYAKDVELVLSREATQNRKLPSLQDLCAALQDAVGSHEDFSIYTGYSNGTDPEVEFEGRTNEGLAFGFTVRITDLGTVDE